MKFSILFALLALTNGASVQKRTLQVMDSFTLQTFTKLFRQTMLDVVALEMNKTRDLATQMQTKITECQPLIKAKKTECTSCAQSTCQQSPTFLDYLNAFNPYNLLEAPMRDITGKMGDVVDLVGDEASGFLNSMKDMAGSLTDGVSSSFTSAYKAMQSAIDSLAGSILDAGGSVIDVANLIGDGFTDLGHSITDTASSVGHEIEHIGSSIGHAIGGLFGREIDAQTRACMEKCESCKPLLLTTDSAIVTAVCGDTIVNMNNTIKARIAKLQAVFNAAVDKVQPVITTVEFDPASMNANMQLTKVFITVMLNGHSQRYQTAVAYNMMALPLTAQEMAVEYMKKIQ